MYFADYHMHSNYSDDSTESIYNICKKAIDIGLNEIAITDHLEFIPNEKYTIDLDHLFLEIKDYQKKYSNKLIIRQGLEVGQPFLNCDEYYKFMSNYKPDFIIGSVHTNQNLIDVGRVDYSKIDCNNFYREYLGDVFKYAKYYDFDTLGHLTYPLRYMLINNDIRIDLNLFEEEFENIFEVLVKRKKGIEVNTSGYRLLDEPLPNFKILKLYKNCGGEIITVGSDAHSSDYLGYEFKKTYKNLIDIGFNKIATYNQREVIFKDII